MPLETVDLKGVDVGTWNGDPWRRLCRSRPRARPEPDLLEAALARLLSGAPARL